MKCPYCNKPNFIPGVVYENARHYGSRTTHFRCLHCRKVIKGYAKRTVTILNVVKSDETEGDWG